MDRGDLGGAIAFLALASGDIEIMAAVADALTEAGILGKPSWSAS